MNINNVKYFKQIDSTHLEAERIARKEIDGTILIADNQTAGIGTKKRQWYTGNGKNIAMTVILKPKCRVKDLEGLTTKISQIIQKTIKELYGYNLDIKLPNDLFLNGKKICGILTEVNSMGDQINYLLISIGFNVNEENFSEETKEIATSLRLEYNKKFSRKEIITNILENLKNEIEL